MRDFEDPHTKTSTKRQHPSRLDDMMALKRSLFNGAGLFSSPGLRISSKSQAEAASRKLSTNLESLQDRLPFSRSSLGLDRTFIAPHLSMIRHLPEVETAWNCFPSTSTMDNLKRASDVFASFNKGGGEHLAVCAMLAECQQRLALYDESLLTIQHMSPFVSSSNPTVIIPNATEDMILAKAKVLWSKGDFLQAQTLCESIISEYDDLNETIPASNLHLASAMTGKALSQLAAMDSLDKAYSVRDYFRIAIKFLERHPSATSLPLVAAHSNCGVAEAVYNIFLEETNDVSVPMSAALKTWFQGLQKIESSSNSELSPMELAVVNGLQANIQANLAWGVLNYETDRSDRLSKSSEYAKNALGALGPTDSSHSEEGIRRVLAIVATCYHQAGSAVTAEGLFQSATDRKSLPVGPLPLLELREALQGYSKLCSEWDKREGDAKRLQRKPMQSITCFQMLGKENLVFMEVCGFGCPQTFVET